MNQEQRKQIESLNDKELAEYISQLKVFVDELKQLLIERGYSKNNPKEPSEIKLRTSNGGFDNSVNKALEHITKEINQKVVIPIQRKQFPMEIMGVKIE